MTYDEVVVCDFEFHQPPGELPKPICMVAYLVKARRWIRLWLWDGGAPKRAPFDTSERTLFVAYHSSAEFSCFLALGWTLPRCILDLSPEFRWLTNHGQQLAHGRGLLGAAIYFGLDAMAASEKESHRDLAIRGGPFINEERSALLHYCYSDVTTLTQLLSKMLSYIDMPRALLRGRYMKAVAKMERTGVPIDTALLQEVRENWSVIKRSLVEKVDTFGIYDERLRWRNSKFIKWLYFNKIRGWPMDSRGQPILDDDTFKDMARELRYQTII